MLVRSRYGSALLLALGMISAHVADAYYYGGYVRYGGPAVVRRTVVVRGRRGRWGRRLAQVDEEERLDAISYLAESPTMAPSMSPAAAVTEEADDAVECDTILDIVETRPEFSSFAEALSDLPRLREAMSDAERTDTLFVPTNDAIESLLEWGGFVDRAEVRPTGTGILKTLYDLATVVSSDGSRAIYNLFSGSSNPITLASPPSSPSISPEQKRKQGIQDMLGNVSLKALIIAYHAVPGAVYSAEDLKTIGADGPPENYLDTALARILASAELDGDDADSLDPDATSSASEPLYIDEFDGDVYVKGIGSEAKVVTADIAACNGVVHAVSHVLLPLDGDGELSEEQKARIAEIRDRSDRLVAEKLDDVTEEEEGDDAAAAPEAAPEADDDAETEADEDEGEE